MIRPKRKSFIKIILHEQLFSVIYFLAIFLIYSIIFELASFYLLIESLKYLWPLIVFGGVVILINAWRSWRIYNR